MEKIKNVNDYVHINSNIDIEVLKGNYKGIYSSRIEDINNTSIFISIPSNKSVPIPLSPGSLLEISFITDKGRFSFKSTVKGRLKDRIPMLELEKPEFILRKELRKYFRVDTRLKASVFLVNFNIEDGDVNMTRDIYDGIIKDISGGGMRILTIAPIKLDQAIEIDVNESLGARKEIFARVVNVFPRDIKSGKIEAGIEYISIKENDRDQIIKYVFKRQIELRKLSK